jgi:hypothetical protein
MSRIVKMWHNYSATRKRVYFFTLRRYIANLKEHFRSWKTLTVENRRTRMLTTASLNWRRNFVLSKHLKALRRYAIKRIIKIDNYDTATLHHDVATIKKFFKNITTTIRHKNLRKQHLLHFVIKCKLLPAWKRFVQKSKDVKKYAKYFTLGYYFNGWCKHLNHARNVRARMLANKIFREYSIAKAAWLAWVGWWRREERLRDSEVYLQRLVEKRFIHKIFRLFTHYIKHVSSERRAADIVRRNCEMKLIRGATVVWRVQATHFRSTRLHALYTVWAAFVAGAQALSRKRENYELAERFFVVWGMRRGVATLREHARMRDYRRVCENVCGDLGYKNVCGRCLKVWKKWCSIRLTLRNKMEGFMLKRGMKAFKESVRRGRIAADWELVKRVWGDFTATAKQNRLLREVKLEKFSAKYGLNVERFIFEKLRSAVVARRHSLKEWFVLWLRFVNSRQQLAEQQAVIASKIDAIRLRAKWNVWRSRMVLVNYASSKNKRMSTTMVYMKIFNAFRQNAAHEAACKKALNKFSHFMTEHSRSVFIAWARHVAFVVKERMRLQVLRTSTLKAEALGKRLDKALIKKGIDGWCERVRVWIYKRTALENGVWHHENASLRRCFRTFKRHGERQKGLAKASNYFEHLRDKRLLGYLGEWHKIASEGRTRVDFIRLRHILRKWKGNVADNIAVRAMIKRFRSNKMKELVGRIVRTWRSRLRTTKSLISRVFAMCEHGFLTLAFDRWKKSPNLNAGIALLSAVTKVDLAYSKSFGFNALRKATRWSKSLNLIHRVQEKKGAREAWTVWSTKVDVAVMWESRCRIWINRLRTNVERRRLEDELYCVSREKRSYFKKWLARTARTTREEDEKERRADIVGKHLEMKKEDSLRACMDSWIGRTRVGMKLRWEMQMGADHYEVRAIEMGLRALRDHSKKTRKMRDSRGKAKAFAEERLLRNGFRSLRGEWRAVLDNLAEEEAEEVREERSPVQRSPSRSPPRGDSPPRSPAVSPYEHAQREVDLTEDDLGSIGSQSPNRTEIQQSYAVGRDS